jgi:hypothetical protein
MEKSEIIRRLTVLDSKCSALLQLSALILTLNMISASIKNIGGLKQILSATITFIFLFISLLSLTVIWVNWRVSNRTVKYRTIMYRINIAMTAIGLLFVVFLTILTIYAQ